MNFWLPVFCILFVWYVPIHLPYMCLVFCYSALYIGSLGVKWSCRALALLPQQSPRWCTCLWCFCGGDDASGRIIASLASSALCLINSLSVVDMRFVLASVVIGWWYWPWRSDCLNSISSVVSWLLRLWKPSVLLFLSASNGAFKYVEMATDFVEPLVVEVLPIHNPENVYDFYKTVAQPAACFPHVFSRNDNVAFDHYIHYICFCCLVEFAAKNVINL